MFLGTHHLFNIYSLLYPHRMPSNYLSNNPANVVEEALLRIDLNVHIEFGGFYECNSHVYLPYTLSALLNLYDYSTDEDVKSQSSVLANMLVRQLLTTTSDKGVANLAVSGRSYPRTRQRISGNDLIELSLCNGHM